MFRLALSARKVVQLHRCGLIPLLLVLPGIAAAQNYLSLSESNGTNLFERTRNTPACCGAKTGALSFVANIPRYERYNLKATYYSLRDNLTTTLMLNNKGSEPILAWPTFYSLGGSRLQLEPITVGAASYLDIELPHLLAHAGNEFQEGSVSITYQGGEPAARCSG